MTFGCPLNIGITWSKPNFEDASLPVEKLGGLEMYINHEKVGSTLLPEFTDASKQGRDFTELEFSIGSFISRENF